MNSEDTEILEEFILETREHLSEIEPDLLEMEKMGTDVEPEIINRIFRAIHSTKGGASFLSFEALKNFSHVMENVLMKIRDGDLAATPFVVDALLQSVDVLRAMVDDVQASDQIPCQAETELLNRILSGDATEPEGTGASANKEVQGTTEEAAQDVATPAEGATSENSVVQKANPKILADIDRELLVQTVGGGMSLYFLGLKVGEDFSSTQRTLSDLASATETIGKYLWCSVETSDFEKLGPDTQIRVLIATVLTPDMACVALEIPQDRFQGIDMESLKEELRSNTVKAEATSAKASSAQTQAPSAPQAAKKPVGDAAGGSKPGSKKSSDALRVKVDLLTKLMNMAGELVLGRNQLLRALEDKAEEIPGLMAILQHVDRVTTELQEGIMQTRMQPIGVLFSRYQRVVRDMARTLGKEIKLVTEGSEVELDKSIIEMLSDPLTHIIRNCVDHAIESPKERQAVGKGTGGSIKLTAFHEGGQVNIIIADDGRGISVDKVLRKAVEKGVVDQAEANKLSQRDIINLVMAPGFSTAEKISDISGRGVGMDVVRTNIEKLGGSIDLETSEGEGTTVMLRLPLTLAIIPSLIVGVQNARFAVPQVGIVELVLVRDADVAKRIELIGGAPTLRLRGKLLPLVRLADLLNIERTYTDPETGAVHADRRERIADPRIEKKDGKSSIAAIQEQKDLPTRREHWQSDYNILVLRAGANQFGVIVDELFDIEEIVVKPLSAYLKDTKCYAGTTILGDGRVIMILDTGGIAELADLRFSELDREEARRQQAQNEKDTSTLSVILFNNAEDEVFAVPQDKVLRLERIQKEDIELMGNQRFIKYRGAGLPVVRLDDHMPVQALPENMDDLFLIIPKYKEVAGQARGGIMASKIIDAMDVEVTMQQPFFEGPGLEGAAIIGDKLTLFLDPVALLDATSSRLEGVVQ